MSSENIQNIQPTIALCRDSLKDLLKPFHEPVKFQGKSLNMSGEGDDDARECRECVKTIAGMLEGYHEELAKVAPALVLRAAPFEPLDGPPNLRI